MAISVNDFSRCLLGLQQLRPFAKQLDDAGIGLAWLTWPAEAKAELTTAHLGYAAAQLLLDPEPPKVMPVHLALLRYLYRLENGTPNFRWGLKADLEQRMLEPSVFHRDLRPGEVEAKAAAERAALPQGRGVLEAWR